MLGIVSNDKRYLYINSITSNSMVFETLEKFTGIDRLLLPLKGIDGDGYVSGSSVRLVDILNINKIDTVYVGSSSDLLELYSREYGFEIISLLKNDGFVRENAYLTAKGLLYILEGSNLLLEDVVILGFGNIGFYLAKLFSLYDIDFYVYTQNEVEKKFASLLGYRCVDGDDIYRNVIINTIPKRLEVDYGRLLNSSVIDVASYPFMMDKDECCGYGVNYRRIAKIPDLYNYKLAGKIMTKYL